jgi:hypothetical protein
MDWSKFYFLALFFNFSIAIFLLLPLSPQGHKTQEKWGETLDRLLGARTMSLPLEMTAFVHRNESAGPPKCNFYVFATYTNLLASNIRYSDTDI